MKIKNILTTIVAFEYDGELEDINVSEIIDNECPIHEEVTQKIQIEEI